MKTSQSFIKEYFEPPKRTLSQNSALHLWLEQIAKELNSHGITLKAVVKDLPQAECMATKENLKECVFRPIMNALYDKQSTTELYKTGEIDKVVEVMNKYFSEHWEMAIPPFPSLEIE